MSTTASTDNAKVVNNRRRKFAPLGIIFGLLGLALFVYFVKKAGVAEITAGIRRLGPAFFLVLAISAIRYVVRSLAWTKCIEAPYRLPLRDAVQARLMGDALGNIVPLASVAVSEPSKAVFVRHRLPLMIGLSGLAVENIFYSLSVALFIFCGTATLLLTFSMPKPLRYASIGALVVTLTIAPMVFLIVRNQWKFFSGGLGFLSKRDIASNWVNEMVPRAQTFEQRIYGFYERNRASFLSIFGLELCFHMAGVLEIYTTLHFISPDNPPTLLTAFILESVNRIINVTFKFVPFRTGVDEAGTGMLAKVLGLTTAIGVTLAIVRKGRDLFWTSVGIVLIFKRGFSLRAIPEGDVEQPQEVLAADSRR
ncbi:MAG TPA: lysylphosphatidylglycerol synthase transmembrane domain-containing protein [Pyrinomonadaceae bacterium]|nr:lysylphosphatidylglycerol synthase transmembrane domain-containing protein [Pyrinomonadaceae bacterium]